MISQWQNIITTVCYVCCSTLLTSSLISQHLHKLRNYKWLLHTSMKEKMAQWQHKHWYRVTSKTMCKM